MNRIASYALYGLAAVAESVHRLTHLLPLLYINSGEHGLLHELHEHLEPITHHPAYNVAIVGVLASGAYQAYRHRKEHKELMTLRKDRENLQKERDDLQALLTQRQVTVANGVESLVASELAE